MPTAPWLLLQLTDGAFPSGGFAHSAGLEAMLVLGGLPSGSGAPALATFLRQSLVQAGRLCLPFVRATAADPGRLPELDRSFDATLPLPGPNRASRGQGRALASAAARIWDRAAAVAEHARTFPAHHSVVFGAVFGLLGITPEETAAGYLHTSARGILSAAVRLGLVGPLEAQRLLAAEAPHLDAVLARSRDLSPDDAAQTAPLIEIFAALHDRLDGRMFQS